MAKLGPDLFSPAIWTKEIDCSLSVLHFTPRCSEAGSSPVVPTAHQTIQVVRGYSAALTLYFATCGQEDPEAAYRGGAYSGTALPTHKHAHTPCSAPWEVVPQEED